MTGPALTAIGLFFVIPALASLLLSFTDFDIYALADIGNLRFIGLEQLRAAARRSVVLAGAGQHVVVRDRRRAAVGRDIAGRGTADECEDVALAARVEGRAVRSFCHDPGRGRSRSGATCSTRATGSSTMPWASSGWDRRLAWRSELRCRRSFFSSSWKNFGYNMVIFLAGLQAVPAGPR